MKKIRILQLGTKNFGVGGLSTIVFQFGKYQNTEKIIYDYFITEKTIDKYYEEEIKKKGGKIYLFKKYKSNYLNIYFGLKKVLREQDFDVIHIHASMAYIAFFYLICTKLNSKSSIIIHSHSSGVDGSYRFVKYFTHKLSRLILCFFKYKKLSCSATASKWMFLKEENIEIVNNGIEIEKFQYNKIAREKLRRQYQLEENFIIGHIGRMSYQKNQEFLLRLFKEITLLKNNAKLIIIGDGPLKKENTELIKKLEIEDKVMVFSKMTNIGEWMSAFDCFVLPSRFEGLPLVGVEAQIAGLNCFFSDAITKEILLTDYAYRISLKDNMEKWIKKILEVEKNLLRENINKNILEQFNIRNSSKKLEIIYEKILEK